MITAFRSDECVWSGEEKPAGNFSMAPKAPFVGSPQSLTSITPGGAPAVGTHLRSAAGHTTAFFALPLCVPFALPASAPCASKAAATRKRTGKARVCLHLVIMTSLLSKASPTLYRGIGSRRRRHVEARLAPAVEQALHVLGLPPLLDIADCGGGEVRPYSEQIPYGFGGRITLSDLTEGSGRCRVREPVARQIDLEREAERSTIVAPAVRIVEVGIPVPAGMIGVELLGAPR